MHLFRSEEHVRRWPQYNPDSAAGTMPVRDLVELYVSETRRHALDGDYISRWLPQRKAERRAVLERIGHANRYWLGS